MTRDEVQQTLGITEYKSLSLLKDLKRKGKLRVVWVKRETVSGILAPVPAYGIKVDEIP